MSNEVKSAIRKANSLGKCSTHVQLNSLGSILLIDCHNELSILWIYKIELVSCKFTKSASHVSFRGIQILIGIIGRLSIRLHYWQSITWQHFCEIGANTIKSHVCEKYSCSVRKLHFSYWRGHFEIALQLYCLISPILYIVFKILGKYSVIKLSIDCSSRGWYFYISAMLFKHFLGYCLNLNWNPNWYENYKSNWQRI